MDIKFKTIVILGAMGVLISLLFSQRHSLKCTLIGFTHFNSPSSSLFLDPVFTSEDSKRISNEIARAQIRVDEVFGKRQANPKIIVAASPEAATKFGSNSTGRSFGTPFEQCIIIGPKGQTVDVIAHELVHAEIGHRLSFYTQLTKLPMWFNEGVALLVDYRPPFLIENIQLEKEDIEQVKKLFFKHQFFTTKKATRKNYQAARLAVNNIAPKELYQKLQQLNQGASFNETFEL